MVCNGALISRTQYAELFRAIGEPYGRGKLIQVVGCGRGRVVSAGRILSWPSRHMACRIAICVRPRRA